MDKVMSFLDAKLMPLAMKLGANRYLLAIRDGFISIMPLTILGSFFYLINNVIFGPNGLTMHFFHNPCINLQGMGKAIIPATMSIMAILAVFNIAKSLARDYEMDTTIPPTIAVVALFVLMPITKNLKTGIESINTFYTGSAAFFLGFVCAIGAVEILRYLGKIEWLKIKMPDSVPPAVGNAFTSMLPVMITVILFGIVRVITDFTGMPLNNLIFQVIQTPFSHIVSSPIGLVIIYAAYMLLWGLGIHSAFIFNPILLPIYYDNINQNAQAFAANQPMHNIMTKSFIDMTTQIGGAGNMLGLIIAIFIVSKRKDYIQIAKLAVAPALFNISEPVMFGLPVVMNPMLILPMILATLVSLGIGALATSLGLMSYTYVLTTSVLPAGLLGFLATGGNIGSIIVTVVILVASTLIYMPFVAVMNKAAKQEVQEEEKAGVETDSLD